MTPTSRGLELFAVRLLEHEEDVLLLDEQLDAVEGALLSFLASGRDEPLGKFLCWAEVTCLDTALLGLVIAVPPVGQYVNRLFWRTEWPSPFGKADAGSPDMLWHPPGELDEAAAGLVRARTADRDRADDSVTWAVVTLEAWWALAATFCPGATVVDLLGDGQPVTELPAGSPGPVHDATSLGALLPLPPQREGEPRCSVTTTRSYAAVGLEPRFAGSVEVECPFRSLPTSHRCRLHDLTVIA